MKISKYLPILKIEAEGKGNEILKKTSERRIKENVR